MCFGMGMRIGFGNCCGNEAVAAIAYLDRKLHARKVPPVSRENSLDAGLIQS
jgi:hypothetical protein